MSKYYVIVSGRPSGEKYDRYAWIAGPDRHLNLFVQMEKKVENEPDYGPNWLNGPSEYSFDNEKEAREFRDCRLGE